MLQPGLYEQLINGEVARELSGVPDARKLLSDLDSAEAANVLSGYVAEVVRRAVTRMQDAHADESAWIDLVNGMVAQAADAASECARDLEVDVPARRLMALMGERDPRMATGGTAKDLPRPETSIAQSSLFTGAVHEPQMFSELKKEIASADRIDMLVSFIKWSGLRLIIDALRAFTERGGILRVITTSYMGATDVKAIEALSSLPNTTIKVSYDTRSTRLHAKAYVFCRETGYTTAYVGSSNLSNAAISSGLEWNVKLTARDLPDTLRKIAATFDAYWNADDYELYGTGGRERLQAALKAEKASGEARPFLFDIRPYPYQQEILDRLLAEREVRGYYRNLVVAATGTGKTVIAALDYKRFRASRRGKTDRLLFIAHREEILKQARDTFAGVLKDVNFGELYVGSYRPESVDHLFISVQTLNAQALWEKLPRDYYDYIVIDETHHAAARSYARALEHFTPRILLGLTATPERMDGRSILDDFDGRIAAEIRLPEAIDRKLLCPFQYFGVSDTADLTELKWVRGGYDRGELSNLYTVNAAVAEKRAAHILRSLDKYAADMDDVRALGFCVSVEHARFMAAFSNAHGVPAMALVGESPDAERKAAAGRLVRGEIRVIYVVDMYNEGVDIPEVNTVLFLRPTESLTIFLQQLGRGLRLSEGKDCLTVLDFIGAANRRYDFEGKFTALLSGTRRSVEQEIARGFVNVPKGCYIQLEKKAQQVVLENIRRSYGFRRGIVAQIAAFYEETGAAPTLSGFLDRHRIDVRAICAKGSFARLCVEAGVREDFNEPCEAELTRALVRLSAIDSRRMIGYLTEVLGDPDALTHEPDPVRRQMLNMFYITVCPGATLDAKAENAIEYIRSLSDCPVMRGELIELLRCRWDAIDFIDQGAGLPYPCALDAHCSYTRDQLFVALDMLRPGDVREGVKYLKDKQTDVLLVTLNKSDKDYSPTTMYNDYALNARLFHWQSQSTTSADSPTGRRYIGHAGSGGRVLLFVREYKQDAFGAAPYTFLGPVDYVRHEGSRPMNIVWRLYREIPAKYLNRTMQVMG